MEMARSGGSGLPGNRSTAGAGPFSLGVGFGSRIWGLGLDLGLRIWGLLFSVPSWVFGFGVYALVYLPAHLIHMTQHQDAKPLATDKLK